MGLDPGRESEREYGCWRPQRHAGPSRSQQQRRQCDARQQHRLASTDGRLQRQWLWRQLVVSQCQRCKQWRWRPLGHQAVVHDPWIAHAGTGWLARRPERIEHKHPRVAAAAWAAAAVTAVAGRAIEDAGTAETIADAPHATDRHGPHTRAVF
ncbi:hypothetical protein BC831DRAFT_66752 [Entophlyctis helioformis]|nr:hypothetical protein BC831DRAFT_66752 [Entophlyctis helioformis]